MNNGVMLNAYPDSMGKTLDDIVEIIKTSEFQNVVSSFYILPSLFHTDLDRGFSVIDYSLNKTLCTEASLKTLNDLDIDLKLDFILNHASVLSPQFQDILEKGSDSPYIDFFIDWNKFWKGCGELTDKGYIQPEEQYITKMFFRKPGLPILMVRLPNGEERPYWNTFYQEVSYAQIDYLELMRMTGIQYAVASEIATRLNQVSGETNFAQELIQSDLDGSVVLTEEEKEKVYAFLDTKKQYLGQMDLNIKSPLVWEFYKDTLRKLSSYGAEIVRLDAFAYAPKEPGEKNFLNEPGTWELLEKIKLLADEYHISLLPEIHASYYEHTYERIAEKGYMTYDFFLPGLIIDALEESNGETLIKWANELIEKKIRTVNMLGCHDGIPLLDLQGMIPEERIQKMIHTIIGRGGFVKDLHGQKNIYYQVNATYFSALGEDERKMILARAIQLFMPGKPQVWYLDLFAGKNDVDAVKRAGVGGHKEINRTNLTKEQIKEALKLNVVKEQLKLLRFRNEYPAFDFESEITATAEGGKIMISWKKNGYEACLRADLKTYDFEIIKSDDTATENERKEYENSGDY